MDDNRQYGNCQSEVFALLADPATHAGAPVRRIDTHSAVVFLSGDRAFKIKRAVRYPFLDFSTPALRKAACEAELEINRVFAPGLYLRLIPITRERDGALRLAGLGESVEWALEMRRFDETKTLDHLADGNAIDIALADELARAVATTHARIPVVESAPWIAALSTYIEQNDAAFRASPDLFDLAQTETLGGDSRTMLDRLRPLLAARSTQGLVRQGHGDLHLGNVVLIDGKPVLFDAIEFNPLIASGDVLYDLAFLLMDLVERDLGAAANVVLNRYLNETRRTSDLDTLAALPFFMSLRAAIRANVTASRARIAEPADRQKARADAVRYFALACRLIRPPPPVLVGIGGLSGTGKSQLARAIAHELAPAPGAVVLRSDVERKAFAGYSESERLPAEAYTAASAERIYATLTEKAGRIIAAGHSAIVDAVFARPEERDALRSVAQTNRVAFHGLFLTTDVATRLARVGSRREDASDADETVARAQERYALGHNDWSSIDASGRPEHTQASARKLVA
ncbi:MAG TPA: AAA family ATPase [Xanthobacteraceae bacterium]|nr:AAA family ATPase [Xanthobacteraceae bacterium]